MPSYQSPTPTKITVGTPHYSRVPTSAPGPTDLITLQLEQACVFVKPAESYQDAVNIARKEFDELASIASDRIAFTLEDKSLNKMIRISESAWSAVTAKLPRAAIIHVHIRPDVYAKAPPPQYLELPRTEKNLQIRHTRSDTEIKRVPSNSSTRSSKSSGIKSGRKFPWIGK